MDRPLSKDLYSIIVFLVMEHFFDFLQHEVVWQIAKIRGKWFRDFWKMGPREPTLDCPPWIVHFPIISL